jgi:hypothetical protein
MTDYFPPSPIPEWPDYSPGVGIEEFIFEQGLDLHRESAQLRSQLYRNGHPLICASCGAKTDAEGNISCGH